MFSVLHLIQPETVEEAYKALINKRNNAVLGGCTFLRLGSQRIGTAIDLSNLGLRYIREENSEIEIGAMATLRDIEKHSGLALCGNHILSRALGSIIGIQFRNVATLGASIFSKYGFSDVITAFLALDADVELHHGGRMSLEAFLARPYEKDILTKVFVHKRNRCAAYLDLRNSASDFPVLNVAVSQSECGWRIAVGARPHCAVLAKQAAALLEAARVIDAPVILRAAQTAADEITFGASMRGSAVYRQSVCLTLVQRAIEEVISCKLK
ncbi:FAD binding domain-containing protein [Azotosporobacter soli]|uniref:FAD binding domain-containing protein n=1 Tax=Azotosporobacter soli TaxID=3055040 RepID=UPI0031FF3ADE